MWATPDAQDPTGVNRFHQHFDGRVEVVDGRLLLTVTMADHDQRRDPVRAAQRLVNQLYELLRVHVDELDQDLVTIADIADRVGLTRQAVNNYVKGTRGPGGFPPPRRVGDTTRVWDWGAVNAWLQTLGLHNALTPLAFGEIAMINGWLHNGYSRGQRDVALVAPPPQEPLPPDPFGVQLAAAFLGVTVEDDVERLVMLLNTSPGSSELATFLNGLTDRLPFEDKRVWEHEIEMAAGRTVGIENAFRAELTGANTVQRHRSTMAQRLHQEKLELADGYYAPGEPYGRLKLAIEVLCAGAGGHCGKRRGFAYYRPGRLPGSPYLVLSNDGRPFGDPLLEDVVRDFNASTDVFCSFNCRHNEYVHTEPDGTKHRTSGVSVRMPFRLLEPAYRTFVNWAQQDPDSGPRRKPIVVRWAPGAMETVYDPNVR
jgi:predicted DNA-binding transcriptional regulator AlpA